MSSPLATLLDRHHYQLIDVMRRQFVMEALTKELDRVTRGRMFRISNGPIWLMLLDTRDLMVIHLASWAKGMYQPGGLIGLLRADHLKSFPQKRPTEERDDSDGWRNRRDREHAGGFARLFPTATGAYPDGAAFDGLKDAFATRMKPVVDDRHENRAHPYEGKGKATGTAKMLDVSELRALVDYGAQLLNDLRMVGIGYPLSHNAVRLRNRG